ncbi:RIMS-binding protein 2-like isoform X5 [Petromyzon marinus]|uniref:RIMS-binding protein 2-like isoform X5 n=1 Tax=Petromyzon marinus TaxID=7757 RepID=UPI003F6F6920
MLQNQKLQSFSATFSTVDVRWSVDGAAGKHGSPILIQPGFLRNGGAAWDVESLARQNEGLRGQLHELEQTCCALREENALLRKSSSVDTEDKVRRLKRKNAELVAIAKRLEERAKKLQEANMRVATTPAPLKLQAVEQYRKAFARQRARDLGSQAAALLSKDKQVDALQREVYRLRHLLHLLAPEGIVEPESDTERLLVASQKEVLRLQRQLSVATGKRPQSLPSPDKGRQISGASQPALRAPPERLRAVEESNRSLKAEVKKLKQEVQRYKRLEGELSKKRKEAEVLEQDVKKRKRRCQELECELKERHQESVRLGKETARLQHRTQQHEREKTEWQERVKAAETEKGSLAEENHQLRAKLDRFEKAQAETNKDHDDVVQVLEAKVHDLEEWCRTHVHHQFGQVSHELERFGLRKAHGDAVNGGAAGPPETQPRLRAATRGGPEATGPPAEPPMTAEAGAGRHELTRAAAVAAAWSSPGPPERMDGTACVAHVVPLPAGGEAASGGASHPQDQPTHVVAEQTPRLRGRLQHGSLSRSFSMEVDTASEVDDLDTDHVSPISSLAARGKSKLQVFIARYSYNPFEGPNENPEAELPLAAGEYVYVYGDMDEDGFYEGELMDGRRGLVPSNFIERISDEDLVAFHQMEGEHSLSQQQQQQQHLHHVHHHHHSCPDRDRTRPTSACSVCWEGQGCPGQCPNPCQNKCRAEVPAPPCGADGGGCKGGRSSETPHRCCGAPYGCDIGQSLPRLGTPNCTEDIDAEEAPPLQDDPRVRHPRGIALIKQLAKSVIISWEPPPLLPPPARTSASSSPSLSTSSSSSASFSAAAPTSYNVLVDDELRMNVRASAKPKALVEKLELSASSYRVSVQCVTARGLSDPALCSLLVGAGATPAPRQLAVRDVTPSSAVLAWLPSSSSHAHAVRANGEQRGEVAAGVRAFTLLGLEPDRHYRIVVEARPQRSHWEPSPEERRRREASIAFRTPPAGLPDAPLHVQVEAGQSTGTLLVSWLPVTIDAMGSSNGSCITGYAIFADGAKVLEVACPTAGSAVLDSSLCEGSSALTVRTLSPCGSSPHSLAARLLLLPPPDRTRSPEGPSPPPSPVAGADGSGTPTRRARSVSKLKMCNHAAGWGSPSRAEPMAAVGEAWYDPATGSSGQTSTDEARLRATEIPCDTGSMGDVPDTLATVQLCAAGSPDAIPSPIVPAVRPAEPPRLLDSEVVGFVPPADGESDCAEASQAKSEEEHGSTQPLCSSMEEFLREMEQDRLVPPPRLEGYQTESSRGSELSDILEEDEEDLMSESVKRSEAQRRRLSHPLRPKHGDTAPSGDAPSVAQSAPGGDAVKPGNACPSPDAGAPWTNPGAAERGPREGVVPVRIFVALFDYDPMSMSPNPDAADEELPFREGQVIKVYGDKDGDGFYLGEAGGQRGFVPCNMVSELQVEEQAVLQEILRRGFLPPDAPLDQIVALESAWEEKDREGLDGRGCWQAGVTARRMIALFDYDPRESSPNVDIEAELSFTAGDIIAIYGDMDEDGFYFGELNSQTGLVPSNFLEEVPGDLEVALSIPDEREADGEQQAEKAAEEAMQDESRAGDHEDAPLNGRAVRAAEAAQPPAAPQPAKAEGPPAEGAAAAAGGGGRSDEEASAEKASALLPSPATSGGGSPKTHGSSSSPASSLEGSPRKKKGFFSKGKYLLKKLGPSKKQ